MGQVAVLKRKYVKEALSGFAKQQDPEKQVRLFSFQKIQYPVQTFKMQDGEDNSEGIFLASFFFPEWFSGVSGNPLQS